MTDIKVAMKRALEMTKDTGLDYGDRKYLPVKDRLVIFREEFGLDYGIDTDVVMHDNFVLASAKVTKDGIIIGSGHGMVDMRQNMSAPVESAETFAVGRALASIGILGNEYASANEMERVKNPPKVDPPLAKREAKAHGPNDGLSEEGRRFKEDVESAFPVVGGRTFFLPKNGSQEEMDTFFYEIDNIDNIDDLSAYYKQVQEMLEWMQPEDKDEVKASFKARRDQLKGQR